MNLTGDLHVAKQEKLMSFQDQKNTIRWKMHFNASPEKVYEALTTDSGRAGYWAESAPEKDGVITFHILNYEPYSSKILKKEPPVLFTLEYFGTITEFKLKSDGKSGTDLSLEATQVDESYRMEMVAGWVSVLMAMKAWVDHSVDLRNHDPDRGWGQGYADN